VNIIRPLRQRPGTPHSPGKAAAGGAAVRGRLHETWPLLLLTLLVLLFLAPVLYPPAGWAVGQADVRGLFIPWLEFARDALRRGTLPLWDPYQFAGYPFLSNPQVAFFYPPMWLAWIVPVRVALSLNLALHIWLMAAGTWLLSRRLGAGQIGALFAALTFGFSGFTGSRVLAGHLGMLGTIAWLPWLLLALHWAAERRHWCAGAVAGLPLALAVFAGHTASLLIIALAVATFALFLWWERREVIVFRQLTLAFVAGTALSVVQLLPFLQFLSFSTRGAAPDFEFATNFSLPPAHLITLLIPDYFGESSHAGYWSVPAFEELTFYAGILPLLLLPLALRRPNRAILFSLVLAILGLWLAMGRYSPLYQLAFRMLPPLRLARAPGRFAILYAFGAALLAGLTLSRWQRHPAPRLAAHLLRGIVATGALSAIAALATTGALFAAQHPSDTSGRLWHQVGGWAWLLLMVAVGGVVLWAVLRPQPRRRAALLGGLLLVLALADLWQLSFKFVHLERTMPTAMWFDAVALIGETEERVLPWGLSFVEQNGAGQVGLRSVFGYNALEPAAIVSLTSYVPDPRSIAYDLLSVGYVVSESPLETYTAGDQALTLFGQQGNAWVYRRARVLPPVRLVSQVEVISDNGAALGRLHQPGFDPATTATVAEAPGCEVSGGVAGTAALLGHEPTRWEVLTESDVATLLVVAEAAYPGWQVSVDGEGTTPVTAYTALRAVCIPPGRHHVIWQFQPVSLLAGGVVSAVTVAVQLFAARQLLRGTRRTISSA
jgi:hypothetical protein